MKPSTIRRFAIAATLSVACSGPALAAPGDLDPDFGTNGVRRLILEEFAGANAVAQLPSGRILVGGDIGKTGAGGTRDFLLAHLIADGTLDAAFGTDGLARDSLFDDGSEGIDRLIVQPDGKVLVNGFNQFGMTFQRIIARYNADGTRDTGFGANGLIAPAPGSSLALDLDGNVLVGSNGPGDSFFVTRYTPGGVLDAGFGAGGAINPRIEPALLVDFETLSVDPEGRIVTVVKADDVIAVSRFFADGSPDADFGASGFQTNFCDNSDFAFDVGFQSDGRIVVGVATQNSGGDNFLCLMRFTEGGEVDLAFDADGKVLSDIPGVTKETPTALDVMKDDRIIVGGEVDAAPSDSAFFAARYEANGAPDATFSGDGFAVFNLSPGETDFGSDVAVLSDGRVVVSGAAAREGDPNFFDAALIALEGDVTDLTLTKTADRTEATVGDGEPIVFTIVTKNAGSLDAYGVAVSDSLPPALGVTSVATDTGTCSGSDEIVCELGVLNVGAEATITIETTPVAAGIATNTAVVAGQIGESNPADNTASVTITATDPPGTGSGTGGDSGGDGGGCALVRL